MVGDDLAVEILKQIRDGITSMRQEFTLRLDETNSRLDQTNSRLDQTNSRLDQTNSRLERVDLGLRDLGEFMRQIAMDQARHEKFHLQHVGVIEDDVRDLKERVRRLEEAKPTH